MIAPLRARLQVAIIVAITAGLPFVGALVRRGTRRPEARELELGGCPALVVQPSTQGPWPAVVLLNGATPVGNRHRAVRRLAEGLARAGYLTVLPELPGLEQGEIGIHSAAAAASVAEALAAHPGARGGRVGLLGVSAGAGLALLAASTPPLAGRISVIVAIAPFADLRAVLRLATTGVYATAGMPRSLPTDPLLGRVVARSLAAALPCGSDRRTLLSWLPVSGDDRDPLAPLPRGLYATLGAGGRAVVDVLDNTDSARFPGLYAALPPEVIALVERLSPGLQELAIDAPVEIVSAPDDGFFPLGEATDLARTIPGARLTVTPVLDHVRLRPTARTLVDLLRLRGFALRTMRAASCVPVSPRAGKGRMGEPARFLLVGAGGYGLSVGCFAALFAGGVSYPAASLIAYLVSNALMYLANRWYTFRLGREGILAGYPRYLAVGLVVSALTVALLTGLVAQGGVDPRLAQAVALLVVTPVAFVFNRRWTFQLAG